MDANEVDQTTDDGATEGTTSTSEEIDYDALVAQRLGDSEEEEDTDDEATDGEAEGDDGDSEDRFIEIDGEKYPLPDLKEYIDAGKNAKEREAAATRKFQEAADMRKSVENWVQLAEAWKSGDPDVRKTIVTFLSAQVPSDAETTLSINAPPTDWEDMTETERFLYTQNMELKKAMQQFQSATIPALDEIKGYVSQTKEERQLALEVQVLKQKHGLDLTPEQVKEWKEHGIADPDKAMSLLKPLLTGAFSKGHEAGAKPKPLTPDATKSKTFDPSDLTADEMVPLLMRGLRPVKSG